MNLVNYLVFAKLPSGKQILYIIFLRRRRHSNLTPLKIYLTTVNLDFSNFMHDSLPENFPAVHLGFSIYTRGWPSENLTAVH